MARTESLSYQGKSIFYMDFSGLKSVEAIEQVIQQSKNHIRIQKEKSIYTLTNIEKMHFNTEIKNAFSDFINGNRLYVVAGAVIGLSGLQRILYNGLMKLTGRDIRTFESKNEAIEWLLAFKDVNELSFS